MSALLDVALFLRSDKSKDYHLLPSDVAILYNLASHIGENEYWYINQDELAKECRIKKCQLSRRCRYLESLGLLFIRRTGKANAYTIKLPTGDSKNNTDMYSSTSHENPDMYSSTNQICTPVHNRDVPEYIHKRTKANKKKKRGGKKRPHALSDDFMVNEKNKETAKNLNITLDEANTELDKFFTYYQSRGVEKVDWHSALDNWLQRYAEYRRKKPANSTGEIKSNVPWYKPEPAGSYLGKVMEKLNG